MCDFVNSKSSLILIQNPKMNVFNEKMLCVLV